MLVTTLFFNIFFMTFFAGLLSKYGMPSTFTIIVEFSVFLLLLLSLKSRSGKGIPLPEILIVFAVFIFLAPLSSFLNEADLFRSIESLRLIFRFYFFYLAVIWMAPDEKTLKKINILLVILLLLQFPVIGVKFIENGIRERTMGGWVNAGHVTGTLWSSCIFYCAAYYYIYKRKNYYIFFAVACVVASILGDKRIVLFLYPIQFIAIYYFIYSKVSRKTFSKTILVPSIIAILITAISGSILYLNKSLNPDKQVGGEIDLQYALEYAERYNEGYTASGYSFGRIATTKRVFNILIDTGFSHLFFGVGPAVTTKPVLGDKKDRLLFEKRFDEFKIHYGLTPMNRMALEYGLIGVIPYSWMLLIFSLRSWKLYNHEADPYWRSFAGGSFGFAIFMLFFFFCYSHGVFWGYTMPPLYFYAMAVVTIRYRSQFKQKVEKSLKNGLINEQVPSTV